MKPRMKRIYCTACQCPRLHRLATRVDDTGHFVRVWICDQPTCCLSTPAGGFVCRMCGHDRLLMFTSNAKFSRPGAIVRLKVCAKCREGHRTVERVEACVGTKAKPGSRGGQTTRQQNEALRAEVRRLKAMLANATPERTTERPI